MADPWLLKPEPGHRGYRDAAEHLAANGLLAAPPDDTDQLRQLWRDPATRDLAAQIAQAWPAVTA